MTLGIQAKEFNLGFIRTENLVSLVQVGCHVRFTEEWYGHFTIKV
jgi:hypothetical protein